MVNVPWAVWPPCASTLTRLDTPSVTAKSWSVPPPFWSVSSTGWPARTTMDWGAKRSESPRVNVTCCASPDAADAGKAVRPGTRGAPQAAVRTPATTIKMLSCLCMSLNSFIVRREAGGDSQLSKAQPRGTILLPGTTTHRPLRCEVRAGSDRAGRPARQPDRHEQPVLANGSQITADQLGHTIYARP